jgi:hypothetical protein
MQQVGLFVDSNAFNPARLLLQARPSAPRSLRLADCKARPPARSLGLRALTGDPASTLTKHIADSEVPNEVSQAEYAKQNMLTKFRDPAPASPSIARPQSLRPSRSPCCHSGAEGGRAAPIAFVGGVPQRNGRRIDAGRSPPPDPMPGGPFAAPAPGPASPSSATARRGRMCQRQCRR